jgi:autotransporter-associated beta strand protein
MNGAGLLTLSGTNTYSGTTTISSGTLALGAAGTVNSTTQIAVAAGATYDVSAIASYTLSSSTSLSASGTGTTVGSTAATIKGATTVNLGAQGVSLTFTPTSFTGDTTHPSLLVSQGALTLSNNTISVNNTGSSALGPGTYRLIQVTGGIINGAPNSTVSVTGSGLVAGATAALSVSGGNVNLVVKGTPAFSNLTSSQSTTYGTTSVVLNGNLSANGASYPANGEMITVTINGNAQNTTISDATGGFSIGYNPSTIPASFSAYTITYSYAGSALLNSASDISKTLTINRAALGIFASDRAKTYGQTVTFAGTEFAATGLKNSETVGSVTLSSSGAAASAPVSGSPYTIAPSAPAGGTFSPGNYTISYFNGALTVGQAGLTVTGLTGNNKIYNGDATATLSGTAILSGVLNGDDVGLGGIPYVSFADKSVGLNKTITVSGYTLTGAAAGNYTLTQPSLNGDITAKGLTITGLTGSSKEYDGTLEANVSGSATLAGVVPNDDVTIDGTPVATFGDKNIGTAKPISVSGYTLSGADAFNYDLEQPSGLTADVTRKNLTVTGAVALDRTYNQTTSATITGATLVGVIDGDDVTVDGTGSFADAAVGDDKPVTAELSLGGDDSGNYTLTQPVDLTADITPRILSVTGAIAQNKTYDRTTSATITGATLVGVLSGDSVTVEGGGNFSDAAVGNGKAVTAALTLAGDDVSQYSLNQPSNLSANITAKGLTVTGLTGSNKVYDGTAVASFTGTPSLLGIVTGDEADVTLSGSAAASFADPFIETGKTITVSGYTLDGAAAGNYSLTQPVLSGDILARVFRITGKTGPDFDSGTNTTTLTVNFVGVPGQLYSIEYSPDLVNWAPYPGNRVDTTPTGSFSIILTASGNQTVAWKKMFFQAGP